MAVLMSFIGMRWFQIDANIMSLAGIAIAIGEVADLGIIISRTSISIGRLGSQSGGSARSTDGTFGAIHARVPKSSTPLTKSLRQ
jgi:multidrug efflux pump subunit AcrB